jgi:hypothetical protein
MHTVDVLMGRAFSWFIFVNATYKSLSFCKQKSNDYGINISFRHAAHSG